jgi:hypothetical protein
MARVSRFRKKNPLANYGPALGLAVCLLVGPAVMGGQAVEAQ